MAEKQIHKYRIAVDTTTNLTPKLKELEEKVRKDKRVPKENSNKIIVPNP